jgi:hypothetical protein
MNTHGFSLCEMLKDASGTDLCRETMMTDANRIDRRRFTGTLAAASGAAAAVFASTLGLAADDKPAADTKDEATAKEDGATKAPPSEEFLLLTILTQRYPSEHFDESAIRGIYSDIRGDVLRGRLLSQFPLKNSDGPSHVFHPYRGSE